MSVYRQYFSLLQEQGKLTISCSASSAATLRRNLFKLNKEYTAAMDCLDLGIQQKKLRMTQQGNKYTFELIDRDENTTKFQLVEDDGTEDV